MKFEVTNVYIFIL